MKKNWYKRSIFIMGCILCVMSVCCMLYFIPFVRPIDAIALIFYAVPIIGFAMGIGFIILSGKLLFQYKGFYGTSSYSWADKVYYGVIRTDDALITYEADTFGQLQEAFQEAVDDYLALKFELSSEENSEKACG